MKRLELEEVAKERDLPLLFADGYDEAILGLANYRGAHQVVYSIDKCIEILARDMSHEDAIEFFYYNVDAYVGEYTPIFMEE